MEQVNDEERILAQFSSVWPADELKIVCKHMPDWKRLCSNMQSLLETHTQQEIVNVLHQARDVYRSQGWNRAGVIKILRDAGMEIILPTGIEKPLIPHVLVYALVLANTYLAPAGTA